MATQTNPVIFVTIGQGASIWPSLSSELDRYSIGSAYINFFENKPKRTRATSVPKNHEIDEAIVKQEVRRVWKDLMTQGQNIADVIRVNYIIGTDSTGQTLPKVRMYMEKYLAALYPAGILTDLYCLLDDNNLLDDDNNRQQTITLLESQRESGTQVYLLSNLASHKLVTTDEIAQTIAMLTLFKDCVPTTYVTEADASRYNEIHFMDNCYAKGGQLLTAYCTNIAVPQDSLCALLLAEVLTHGKNTALDTGTLVDEEHITATAAAEMPRLIPIDYFLNMAIPEFTFDAGISRRQWIAELFGKRLEMATAPEITAAPNLIDGSANLYDLLRYTGTGGTYDTYVTNAIQCAQEEAKNAKTNMDNWLNKPPNLEKESRESVKRRLSPLLSQDLWPFVIASDYVKKQAEVQFWTDTETCLNKTREAIQDAHQRVLEFVKEVDEVIHLTLEDASHLTEMFAPFSPHAVEYFRMLFSEYCKDEKNHAALTALSCQLVQSILDNDFQRYLDAAASYIKENIITHALFAKPIMTVMHELLAFQRVDATSSGDASNTTSLSTALGDWVFNNRCYSIRLKTGYSNLYTEANLFMPEDDAANVKKRYEDRGLGRVNLFAEQDADRVCVLYHAGAFNVWDMFYASIYTTNTGEQV